MKKEIRIGLTLIAALAIFYLALTWLNRTQLFAPEENNYFISFDNVNGLLEGDPVLIRGYTSGRVLSISPESDRVAVKIALDKKIQLYEDALAEIQIKELMGGKQVAILTGNSGSELGSGGEIAGKIALDFSSGFSQFSAMLEGLDLGKIAQIMDRADSLMQGLQASMKQVSPERLDRAFSKTEHILGQLDQTLNTLNSQVDFQRIDTLLSQAERGLKKGTDVLANTDELMQRFKENSMGNVEESLEDLPVLMEDLKVSVKSLNELTASLNNSQTLAGRLISDDLLSRRLDTTIYNLNKTLELIHSQKVIVGFRRKKK